MLCWVVPIVGGLIIGKIIKMRKRKDEIVRTHIDRYLAILWTAAGFTFVFTGCISNTIHFGRSRPCYVCLGIHGQVQSFDDRRYHFFCCRDCVGFYSGTGTIAYFCGGPGPGISVTGIPVKSNKKREQCLRNLIPYCIHSLGWR